MFKKLSNSRFAVMYALLITYIIISFVIRCVFFMLSYNEIDFSFLNLIKIFGLGFVYDFGASIFFVIFYVSYLVIIPKKMIGAIVDKILTYFIVFITLFIISFSFLAEFPFWNEFNTRYNFIAVDYLIYTYEVVENINESYPLPLLISILFLISFGIIYLFTKTNKFKNAFSSDNSFKYRLLHFLPVLIIALFYNQFVNNKTAEISDNTYNNELTKNGVYSFFAAYRSNELDFKTFYTTLNEKEAFSIIKKELKQENQQYISKSPSDILRITTNDSLELKPNIVLICIESFNANFMSVFGNKNNLTPNIDQLASESVLLTNMYATGTRTIRGMEAITLSVPPTPGRSIVKRPNNNNLYSIASILKQKKYNLNFFYGGDGYFDNMNTFFGGQGFNIIDRNRGNPLSDNISTSRVNIEDNEVTFENAWGVCDEDIYSKLLKVLDENNIGNKPTFNFVMTTSNHRPYSFPINKIDLPNGSRKAAVKYTDYALGNFLKQAKEKPWFKNTVFVIIADHCASSAGKWDITLNKHHIPAIIYNLPKNQSQKITKLVSQIDIMPTLFGYLNWNYTTALYGKDINRMTKSEERALIGNYKTVGLLKDSIFTEINDHKEINQYIWDNDLQQMSKIKESNKKFKELTISYYQTASQRYTTNLMKEK